MSDAEHEAIALELRELNATLEPLIAAVTDSRPEPPTAAGPDLEPAPPAPPEPDEGTARDRAPGPAPSISDHRHPAPVPPPDDAAPTRTLLASVYFPFNSVRLVPSEKITLIDLLAQVRGKRLLFVGFTDRLGDKDTNTRLAYRRARAVKAFFRNTGLDPAHLFAAAKGPCCYKNDGTTPTGRRQNRRVEIYETTEDFQPRPLTRE
ncbi:MAG: OmpA family protein [Nitrospira sp.]|nr:OmpA family protein [Nitrospira sp.]